MNHKRLFSVLCAVLLLTLTARAASEPRILQQRFDPDTNRWTLYTLRHDGAKAVGASIDGAEVEDATFTRDPAKTPVVTWILCDTSASMPEELREKVSDLLLTLLGEKGKSETHNFCTFSNSLRVEVRESGSFTELKERVDALEYDIGTANLAGALNEVMSQESHRIGATFARVIVITAGGESIPSGDDARRLRDFLQENNIPIYTVGCQTDSNADILSWLYALSARTGARSWDISEVGAADIANIMHWEEIPVRVLLTAPDGGDVEVTFDDDTTATTTIPPTEILPPLDLESHSEPEPEPVQDTNISPAWGIALLAVFLVIGGVAAFLILRKPKKKPVPAGNFRGENTSLTLYLTDIENPERRFSAPLRGRVTIGRGEDNMIALDYDQSISRTHCEIFFRDGALWIRDTASSGGTYVNGERVETAAPIPSGAVVRLGHVDYRVET